MVKGKRLSISHPPGNLLQSMLMKLLEETRTSEEIRKIKNASNKKKFKRQPGKMVDRCLHKNRGIP